MKQKIFIGEIFNQLSAKWPGLWMAAMLGDLVLIQTSLCFCYVNHVVLMLTRCIYMTEASVSKVCIKPKSPPASLPFKCQVTKQSTVKWSTSSIHLSNPYLLLYWWCSWIRLGFCSWADFDKNCAARKDDPFTNWEKGKTNLWSTCSWNLYSIHALAIAFYNK